MSEKRMSGVRTKAIEKVGWDMAIFGMATRKKSSLAYRSAYYLLPGSEQGKSATVVRLFSAYGCFNNYTFHRAGLLSRVVLSLVSKQKNAL
jgi:hypothetical protein